MENTSLAIDLAKISFHASFANKQGRVIKEKKKLTKKNLRKVIADLPPGSTVAFEACGGAHHWGRKVMEHGHTVKMMAPQFVKPYVKGEKNDANDAAAIAEAASRPHMEFVPVKNLQQQDMKMLHSIRDRLVGNRVRLTNSIRGILLEYGIVARKGDAALKKVLLAILEVESKWENGEEVTGLLRRQAGKRLTELKQLQEEIDGTEKEIIELSKIDDNCKRLQQIPGIGPLTSSALIAHVGNAASFKSGRQFAAYWGLVPKQHSTGGKTRLLGISKRGDKKIRALLIHGARAVIASEKFVKVENYEKWASKRTRQQRWAQGKLEEKGMNRAAVALANKHARIAWAILVRGCDYQPQHESVRPSQKVA